MAALADGFGLLERAVSYALASAQLVTPELLPRATPCAGWDLRLLLCHVGESLDALREGLATRRVGPGTTPPEGAVPADVVAGLRRSAARLLGACAAVPGDPVIAIADREMTASVLAAAGAIEIGVHGWDISVACGSRRPIPPALADSMLRIAPLLIPRGSRDGLFADPVPAPALASPGDRLVAFLGRDPKRPAAPRPG
ncbi:MAG: TIGR03086 family metal-binding protein [Micromonosporaceae bacterium]